MKSVIFITCGFFLLAGCQSSLRLLPAASGASKLIQVQGHRGSRGTHPENTLAAFDEAVLSQADWIELDLVLTKEGIPLVSHDPAVSVDFCLDEKKRPLTQLLPIRQLPLSRIKTFDCGSFPNPNFPEQKPVPGQTMPTLDEVLIWTKRYPDKKIKFNIELKMTAPKKELEPNPKAFVDSVITLIKKHKQIEQVILQSFDFRVLKIAKEMEPKLKLSALFDKPASICQTTKNLGAQVAAPDFNLVTLQLVDECHRLGLEVHPWTLNSEGDWKKAVAYGVDGIITDYPRKLKTYLANR